MVRAGAAAVYGAVSWRKGEDLDPAWAYSFLHFIQSMAYFALIRIDQ
jgi:hypothetical protein